MLKYQTKGQKRLQFIVKILINPHYSYHFKNIISVNYFNPCAIPVVTQQKNTTNHQVAKTFVSGTEICHMPKGLQNKFRKF